LTVPAVSVVSAAVSVFPSDHRAPIVDTESRARSQLRVTQALDRSLRNTVEQNEEPPIRKIAKQRKRNYIEEDTECLTNGAPSQDGGRLTVLGSSSGLLVASKGSVEPHMSWPGLHNDTEVHHTESKISEDKDDELADLKQRIYQTLRGDDSRGGGEDVSDMCGSQLMSFPDLTCRSTSDLKLLSVVQQLRRAKIQSIQSYSRSMIHYAAIESHLKSKRDGSNRNGDDVAMARSVAEMAMEFTRIEVRESFDAPNPVIELVCRTKLGRVSAWVTFSSFAGRNLIFSRFCYSAMLHLYTCQVYVSAAR
jgi:hypothetical protein